MLAFLHCLANATSDIPTLAAIVLSGSDQTRSYNSFRVNSRFMLGPLVLGDDHRKLRNVTEWRCSFSGGIECSQPEREAPERRYAERGWAVKDVREISSAAI